MMAAIGRHHLFAHQTASIQKRKGLMMLCVERQKSSVTCIVQQCLAERLAVPLDLMRLLAAMPTIKANNKLMAELIRHFADDSGGDADD